MSTLFFASMIILLVLTGAILAITPLITRHDEVFAVTIPAVHYHDPEIVQLRQRYVVIVLLITAVAAAVTALAIPVSEVLFSIAFAGAFFAILVGSLVLYARYRKKVQELKEHGGWDSVVENIASASLSTPRDIHLPSLWWNLLYIPIVVATVIIGIVFYPQIPAQIPMQTDFAGNITSYTAKSIGVIFYVPLIQAFVALIMTFVMWSIQRSRRAIDPLHAVSSAQRSAEFSRVWSIGTLVMGLALILMFTCMQLSFIGVMSLDTAGIIVMAVCLLIIVGCIVLSVKYGQSGARLANDFEDGNILARDDDRYWKFGIFYYNPDDPALFLPKRFGIGWTNNFAQPLSWVFIVGLIVLIAVLLAATHFLT